MRSTRFGYAALLALVVVVLIGAYFYWCARPEVRGRELLLKTLRSDFVRSWAAYKSARLKGDAATILRFYPPGHVVRSVRGDNVYLIHRKAAEREARIRYRVYEDIEGPYIVISRSGCCIWAITRIRAEPGPDQPSSDDKPAPEQGTLTQTFSRTGAGDWQSVASSNAIEDPTQMPAGVPLSTVQGVSG